MSYHYDIVYFMDPAILKQDMKFTAMFQAVEIKSTIQWQDWHTQPIRMRLDYSYFDNILM